MTWTVTLERLRACNAYLDTYNRLVRALQGKPFTKEDWHRKTYIKFAHKDRIPIKFVLDSIGLRDALCVAIGLHRHNRDLRLYAVWCARQVEHLMTDPRSIAALDVAERFANKKASVQELAAAAEAAWEAYDALCAIAKTDVDDDKIDIAVTAGYTTSEFAWEAAFEASALGGIPDAASIEKAREDMFRRMLAGTAPWQSAQ